jgi:hypothetical protein
MISYSAIQLYDKGLGPNIIPVTPPGCPLAPSSSLHPKSTGKAPGYPTQSGWISFDLNNPKFRCHDYAEAKLWGEWGANVGFVAGDGYVVVDNDQGGIFSQFLRRLLPGAPRRFVADPKHERDAFLVRVLDFVGDPVALSNQTLKFAKGVLKTEVQILAKGKQFVVAGVHPGTRAPYVWDREIDEVPVITAEAFSDIIKKFIVVASAQGWTTPDTGPDTATADFGTGNKTPPIIQTINQADLDEAIAQAKALLDLIPNRDVPPGEKPNAIDEWLDDYVNWTTVSYALAAFLGGYAHTPQARGAWNYWSDGRVQENQSSDSVWKSVLLQPLKMGAVSLVHLVRSLVPVKAADDFPDLEPDDPDLQTLTPVWDALKARWAFSMAQGFIDMQTGLVVDKQGFSDGHAHLAPKLRRELHVPARSKPKAGDMFLTRPDHVRVFDITYAPGDPAFVLSKDPVLKTFNRWKGTTLLAGSVTEDQVKPWLDHLLFVLGTKEERARFLRWCAFVCQHPELKPNWHYLIMSLAGLGKDTMVAPIKLAVGAGNWKEELIYSLANNFNEVVEHKFLIIGETAQPKAGMVSAQDFGTRLKPLLAQPPEFITINKKFQQPYEIPNRLAVILFSNDRNPLYLERGSRRVHVVNRLGAKPDTLEYYWPLQDWLHKGGAELAASFLLAYQMSEAETREFIGGRAPESDDKVELEHQNTQPHLAALEDLIADARKGLTENTPTCLVATAEQLASFIKQRGLQSTPSPQNIRTWLLDMERQGAGVYRARIDPKEPHLCGVVDTTINGSRYAGRLWFLSDNCPDGRAWKTLSVNEIVAIWKNLPPQVGSSRGNVVPFQKPAPDAAGDFPDGDEAKDEPV